MAAAVAEVAARRRSLSARVTGSSWQGDLRPASSVTPPQQESTNRRRSRKITAPPAAILEA